MKPTLVVLLCLAGTVAHATTGVSYYHTDRLGSPVLVTDEQARTAWRTRYRAFGSRDQSVGYQLASAANPLWYSGHEEDIQTGLSYMQARYYSPRLARFLSTDPRPFSGARSSSFNRYAYANNNPYRYVDPDGREAVLVSVKGTAAPGAGVSAGVGLYLTFPGAGNTPYDIGLFNSGAVVAGADMSATFNFSMHAGGRENIEGLQLTTGATLPLTGVAGPAIDVEHTINPQTGESIGSSLGVGLAAFPNASVAFGGNYVTFSVRDILLSLNGGQGSESPPVDVDEAISELVWFDHIAM